MEAEARRILQTALTEPSVPPGRNLYERVRVRFTRLGGADLELPYREPAREPPGFDGRVINPWIAGWLVSYLSVGRCP